MATTDPTAAFEAAVQRRLDKAAKKEAKRRLAAGSGGATSETAPAAPAATETAPAAPVAETAEQREARIAKLVQAQVAAAASAEGLSTQETDEQMVARLVEAQLVPLRQIAAERGGVVRKGLAPGAGGDTSALESIAEGSGKALQESTNDDLAKAAAAAFPRRR